MAVLKPVFLDTGVLVAGMVDLGASSRAPFQVLDAVAEGVIEGPGTAWHCCLEFFSVTTRLPEEYRLDSAAALRFLHEEVFERFTVHALPSKAYERFLDRAVADGIAGGGIYDAHIAEVARDSGARLVVTENRRHFARLLRDEIRVVDCSELVRQLGTRSP